MTNIWNRMKQEDGLGFGFGDKKKYETCTTSTIYRRDWISIL